MAWWIWLVGGLVLLLAELLTPGGFYLLFFGVGALAAGLIAWMGFDGLVQQALAFVAVSVVCLLFFRKPLVERLQRSMPGGRVDNLVGETAILTEKLAPGEHGQAELRGSTWKVRNVGGLTLEPGTRCVVERVDGLTLVVRSES